MMSSSRHLADRNLAGRPEPEQERWLVLAARYPAYRDAEAVVSGTGQWRTVSLLVRCGFFVLGLIAALAACGLFFLMCTRYALIPAGIGLYLVAEWLLRERRVFAAGLEEALLAAGSTLLALGFLDATDTLNNETALYWAISMAWLLAGIRLLNPLFTTMAAMMSAVAVNTSLRHGHYGLAMMAQASQWTSLFCLAIATTALWLGQHPWQRPAHDRMFDWLVVTMPVTGYVFLLMYSPSMEAWQYDIGHDDAAQFRGWSSGWIVGALAGFGCAAVSMALRRRTHAPLFAALGCAACLAYELRHLTGLPLYTRLILWGTLLLLASYVLERWLRMPRAGITAKKLQDHDLVVDVVELAGSSLAAPAQRSAPPDATAPSVTQGQGGQFGGGGASGKY